MQTCEEAALSDNGFSIAVGDFSLHCLYGPMADTADTEITRSDTAAQAVAAPGSPPAADAGVSAAARTEQMFKAVAAYLEATLTGA